MGLVNIWLVISLLFDTRHCCPLFFLLRFVMVIGAVLFFCFSSIGVRAQIVTSTNANIDFGRIDLAASQSGRVQLGTNGDVSATGSGLAPRDDGNAGRVRITSPDTGTLEVKCSSSGALADPGVSDLAIENVEIAVNTGVPFGSGISCNGVQPADAVATTLDMDSLGDPDVLIGGDVPINNLSSFPADREYEASDGGSVIRLSITVQ